MWKVMEQDTQGLPLASMHMQECTPTHVDTHINPTHHMHTNGHISKLHFRNLFQWKWIKYSHEKTREEDLRRGVMLGDVKKWDPWLLWNVSLSHPEIFMWFTGLGGGMGAGHTHNDSNDHSPVSWDAEAQKLEILACHSWKETGKERAEREPHRKVQSTFCTRNDLRQVAT